MSFNQVIDKYRKISFSERDKGDRFERLMQAYLQTDPTHYDVKLMMGHASVTTTEQYSKMNLKRVAQDFPTLVSTYAIEPKMGKEDTLLEDTAHIIEGYVPLYDKIES